MLSTERVVVESGLTMRQVQICAEREYAGKVKIVGVPGGHGRARAWTWEHVDRMRMLKKLRQQGLGWERAVRILRGVTETGAIWAVIAPDQWFPANTEEEVTRRMESIRGAAIVVRVG